MKKHPLTRSPADGPRITGLGDLIKRGTTVLGIKPCEACRRRAEQLNKWMPGRRS